MIPSSIRHALRGFIFAFVGLLSVAIMTDARAADAQAADKRSILAVMEIEDASGKLNAKDVRTATEFLRGRLTTTGKFIVIDQSRQAAALKKIVLKSKQESYKECRAKECQIPLGQELSADSILRTSLLYMGGGFTLQAELIDLSKEAAVKGAAVDFDETPGTPLERSLSGALRALVAQLVADKTSAAPSPGADPLRNAGFGAGLAPVPQDGAQVGLPVVERPTVGGEPDFKLLDLVQAAREAEKGNDASDKAEKWEAVAWYKETPPELRRQAKARAKTWRAQAGAKAAERRQKKEVREQYTADQIKLEKYLNYDDNVVSPKQKQAYLEEFDKAYTPWAEVVGYTPLESKTASDAPDNSASQHNRIGVKFGLQATSVTCGDSECDTAGWRTNYNFGLFFGYGLTESVGIRGEVLYSTRSVGWAEYSYVEVPLLLTWRPTIEWLDLFAGFYKGFIVEEGEEEYRDDFGFVVGTGVFFPWEEGEIQIDVRVVNGMTYIGEHGNDDTLNKMWAFNVGYAF